MGNFNEDSKKFNDFEKVVKSSYLKLEKINNLQELLLFEKDYLKSKDSNLSSSLSEIKSFTDLNKKIERGKEVNAWKSKLSKLIEVKREELTFLSEKKLNDKSPKEERSFLLDKKASVGSLHLINKSLLDIYSFFVSRGYEVFESSEVETKWYNFDSLNLKDTHPARSWSDTFYFTRDAKFLLRTHTSGSESRAMENNKNSEIMVVSGGKVYRNDDDDLTHSHQYTNIEVMRIDRKVSFANLKWILEDFFKWFFEKELTTRFRPSFFPFTEPSFEVDISCSSCENNSKSCKVCKGTGWIEILGAGLLNPVVLRNNGYDERKFSGFAAGIGLERILMVKHGINDVRDFYANDPRFLIQTSWK